METVNKNRMIRNLLLLIGCVCVGWLTGCNSEDVHSLTSGEGGVHVRLATETQLNTVHAFRFEQNVLEEVWSDLASDGDGIYRLNPERMKGTVYFLANASPIIQRAGLVAGRTTLEEFLALTASAEEMQSEGIAMTGIFPLDQQETLPVVTLERCMARLDLDSSFKGVRVRRVSVSDVMPGGFVHAQPEPVVADGWESGPVVKEFDDPAFENRKEPLFYLCEQAGTGHEVEVLVEFGGGWHRLKSTLPALERNTVYTLKVHGAGGEFRLEVLADTWEQGEAAVPDLSLKALVDRENSVLSEGVELNERGDSVFVPYWKSDLSLALLAGEGAEVSLKGKIDGVSITETRGEGLQPVTTKVLVASRKKMPGSVREYAYVDVHQKGIHTGRVVLVFMPNPIYLDGKLRFDENGVCDFNGYADGLLARLVVPEGKQAKLRFPEQEALWIRLDEVAPRAYQVQGGWKPNDPLADGREQTAELIVSNSDGSQEEIYVIKRRNWGLPVVQVAGVWWCKYNLRGNVKDFSDQILIGNDPVGEGNLADYLATCSDEDFFRIAGDQYQAGNPEGLPLVYDGEQFYYEGWQNQAGNFGVLKPETMAPDGYQIPDYDDYRMFTWGNNCNLGYQSNVFNNGLGQRFAYSVYERSVRFQGTEYGPVGFYDFDLDGVHWVLYGLGHQWGEKSISNRMILLATYGHTGNTWLMEGYTQLDGRGNWFKYAGHNAQKTRTIRCIKTPVEYIYE